MATSREAACPRRGRFLLVVGWFAILLAHTGEQSLGFHVKPHAQYLAVAISDRYKDSLNALARSELQALGCSNIHFSQGQWYFDARPPVADATALTVIRHIVNLRSIALSAGLSTAKDPLSAHELAQFVDENADWNTTLEDVCASFPYGIPSTCRVVSRRSLPPGIEWELQKLLVKRFRWRRAAKGSKADITVHLRASRGTLQVEVPLLYQPKAILGGGLPQPGLGHVEAWACARSLEIQSQDLVLDPMCGKGTLLAEAAVWWPNASFVGCDVDKRQLDCCRCNFDWLQRKISLYRTDVTRPQGIPFPDGSVNKVLVAPPWNRQFRIRGDPEVFYRAMFKEILRVLHPAGKLVFVGASGKVIHKLEVALRDVRDQAVGSWTIVAKRSFYLTRRVTGVMAVVENGETGNADVADVADVGWKALPWEGKAPDNGRDLYNHWRVLRALEFPNLRPASEPPKTQSRSRWPLLLITAALLGSVVALRSLNWL